MNPVRRVIQLVPALHSGDAIGNNALAIRNHFKAMGIDSRILCLEADSELASETLPAGGFDQYDGPETLVVLHYALPSPLNALFFRARGPKILVYHNITPPQYLRGYPHLQHIAVEGRRALAALRDTADIAVADSEYNRRELVDMGFKNTVVIPIYLDFTMYERPVSPVLMDMFDDDFVNILFVGRLTPNKCQHDLIRFYGFYKRFVRERSRLFLVGKWDGFETYYFQLMRMATDLKLGDIYLTGRVDTTDLVTFYRKADVFVSFSEHEGFGVPLIESMYFDIPIMAFSAAAVPYTMNGSGVLFSDKRRMPDLAELMDLVVVDSSLNSGLRAGQKERLRDFLAESLQKQWMDVLDRLNA